MSCYRGLFASPMKPTNPCHPPTSKIIWAHPGTIKTLARGLSCRLWTLGPPTCPHRYTTKPSKQSATTAHVFFLTESYDVTHIFVHVTIQPTTCRNCRPGPSSDAVCPQRYKCPCSTIPSQISCIFTQEAPNIKAEAFLGSLSAVALCILYTVTHISLQSVRLVGENGVTQFWSGPDPRGLPLTPAPPSFDTH